jgi:GH15 family glucan-1,4-alpha-glucosidase
MAQPLEDYALVGDTHTAALVGRDGSVDWLCLPRFDSGACFAALLGDERHGRWLLAPDGARRVTRRYRSGTHYPQAFSHVGLINTAHNLARTRGRADRRSA